MTKQLWINIGLLNTGTAALQRYTQAHSDLLKSKGVDFLHSQIAAGQNDLCSHIFSGRRRQARWAAKAIRDHIAGSAADIFVLSSEMFSLIAPADLKALLALGPALDTYIVGYFPRQDQHIEGLYAHNLMAGKIEPGFDTFLRAHGREAGNYQALIDAWRSAWPEARFVFRRFDKTTFPNGNLIDDFLALLGIDLQDPDLPPRDDSDQITPSLDLLELMHLVSQIPRVHAERVFNRLATTDFSQDCGRLLDRDEARSFFREFEDHNDALRQHFFPEDEYLFDTSDFDSPWSERQSSSFTPEQRNLILELFKSAAICARGE